MGMSAAVSAVILALTLVGCGSASDPESTPSSGASATASSPAETDADSTTSAAACGEQTTPHPELARQLPAGFPTVAGWSATEVVNQGRTRAVQGVLPGEAADLVRVRDTAASQITVTGYSKTGSDEEPGFEAEAEFEGPHEVSIKVKPLCRGDLALTYTVRQ
jgi:hypothetical protein